MNTEIEKIYLGDELDKFIIKMSDLINEAILEMNKEQIILPDITRKNIASVSNMLAKHQIYNIGIFFSIMQIIDYIDTVPLIYKSDHDHELLNKQIDLIKCKLFDLSNSWKPSID